MFDSKRVQEIKDYGFSFVDEIGDQTLDSATVTGTLVYPTSGTSGLSITNIGTSGGVLSFYLGGGTYGEKHRIVGIGTISDGRILEMDEFIEIK